jgi:glycerol-3-phosphate dehydrogenase
MSRKELLNQVRRQEDVSVLIVGGGINGVGLLRELALQGVDALLVEKSDFCAGASAAPSRMIHGGLRYLENGELRLVRESLRERDLLLQNAPHYVRPLPTTIPVSGWASGLFQAAARFLRLQTSPANRGAILIKLGLLLYDLLTYHKQVLPRHTFTSRAQSLAIYPGLNPDIVCTATYHDAWISYPERLGLELVLDAEALDARCRALNYVSMVNGQGESVTLRDELTGDTLTVRPRVLINASGAWIDQVNQKLRLKTAFIGGTKGSHLVVDHAELLASTQGKMFFYENKDGRVCILFPLLDKVLIGSTDIRVDRPEEAITTEEDIEYILDSARQVFPKINLKRSDIVFHFCGVRPLPNEQNSSTGQISRDHHCRVIEPDGAVDFPVYALVGGKWTTFRAFAEQVTDRVLAQLGRERAASSQHLAIGGGRDFPRTEDEAAAWVARVQAQTDLPAERIITLLGRYGSRAAAVAAFICQGEDVPLRHHQQYSHREIEFLICQERVCRLDDLILRRTTIALQGELTAPLLQELAEIAAPLLDWSASQTQAEISRTRQILMVNHGVLLTDHDATGGKSRHVSI